MRSRSWLRILMILVFGGITAASVGRAAASGRLTDFEVVDAWVEARMAAARIPGLALSIVDGERIVHQRGFGLSRPDGTPMTARTPFIIGSLSKSVTALAIMQLVDAGEVDLDASVERYLPWLMADDREPAARITVRELLHQTSGFSAVDGRRWAETNPAWTIDQEVRSYSRLELNRPVGASFEYSNVNYNVLGSVVEVVSGQPYETYVQRHIFDPLDMERSFTSDEDARSAGLAAGHRFWFGFPVVADSLPYLRPHLSSAYLVSTADDLGRYLIAHLNGGSYGGVSLVSPDGMAELHRPAVDVPDGRSRYAMGWFVSELNGIPALWHPGDVPNFRAMAVLVPERRWGVVVLMNASSPLVSSRLDAIAPGILSLMDGDESPPVGSIGMYAAIVGLTIGMLVLQVLRLIRSVSRLRRSPYEPPAWGLARIILALLVDVGLVLFMVALPRFFVGEVPLRTHLLFEPDVTVLFGLILVVALVWGPIRTGWALVRYFSAAGPATRPSA